MSMRLHFRCPVCGEALHAEPQRYLCAQNHSFDRARSGYVNLLQRQSRRTHGDDPRMVAARRAFLDAGYYQPLLQAITEAAIEIQPRTIADIGCGEGWYSCHLLEALHAQGNDAILCGIDISADALRFAANRAKTMGLTEQTAWAAGSINRIPLAPQSCDLLLNIFAPMQAGEFSRVIRRGGVLLRVIPLERHLWQLKEAVYPQPYENRPVLAAPDGFTLEQVRRIETTITVSGTDLQQLFTMTPYVRKTAPEDAQKLLAMEQLTTEIAFGLLICRENHTKNG